MYLDICNLMHMMALVLVALMNMMALMEAGAA